MRIAAVYSFNKGKEVVTERYPNLLVDVNEVIRTVDASQCKTKLSEEGGRRKNKLLYWPVALNHFFKQEFKKRGWEPVSVECDYSDDYYTEDYTARHKWRRTEFREMDFVKEHLGIEVQLGKYSFMVYNVSAKMTIFKNLGVIDTGIEIVPVKSLVGEMSSGVSYFEQFEWDLRQRGVSNIDIPVLILGIDADEPGKESGVKLEWTPKPRKGRRPGPKGFSKPAEAKPQPARQGRGRPKKPEPPGITIKEAMRQSRAKRDRESKE